MVKNKTGLIRLFVSSFTNCEKNIPIITNDEENNGGLKIEFHYCNCFPTIILQYYSTMLLQVVIQLPFFYRIGKINPVFEKSICLKFN